MRQFLGLAVMALSSLTANATPYTYIFTDAYQGQAPGSLGSNGDVLGALRRFDIDQMIIDGNAGAFTISIYVNYGQEGGDTSLSGINISPFPTLYLGDVMFNVGSSLYAIPVISHTNTGPGAGGLTAANLYLVTSYLTSRTVLNDPPTTSYRPESFVWANSNGAVNKGAGTRNVTNVGGVELLITLAVNTTDAAFINALQKGPFSVHFASATCGNDLLDGTVQGDTPGVPEPVTYTLIGTGLAALALVRRKA